MKQLNLILLHVNFNFAKLMEKMLILAPKLVLKSIKIKLVKFNAKYNKVGNKFNEKKY